VGLDQQVDVVLVDSLAVWVSNRLLALGDAEQGGWWAAVEALDHTLADEVGAVLALARDAPWHLMVVTNEVGCRASRCTPGATDDDERRCDHARKSRRPFPSWRRLSCVYGASSRLPVCGAGSARMSLSSPRSTRL
jgi:hypothetical protein